jgi:2-dehydro-3-deoxyphosphogluconate aldolase/(4S)-4-hydroxy-2-oxoglutarate aldolase
VRLLAKHLKHEVINRALEVGIIPVFYNPDIDVAKRIIRACAEGGAKVLEYTNRGDRAFELFGELVEFRDAELPDVVFGAGTIIEAPTASIYINSGAEFIVGPQFSPEVSKLCNRRKIPYIPGCSTPSEISAAEEAGSEIVKVFPAGVLTPAFIKAFLAPSPWSRLLPSGGIKVAREDIQNWIKAGAAAINLGSDLISHELVKAGDFEGLTRRTEQCILWVREARGDPLFQGVEHIGLYPTNGATVDKISAWYAETFGFNKVEGKSSIFLNVVKNPGRIEVSRERSDGSKCHIAISVSNFEEACKVLKEKGIELEEPTVRKGTKSVYLKNADPAGNRVHLLYVS